MDTTCLIDGMNLAYRIKFTSGVTDAFSLVDGFLETLYTHLQELQANKCIVIWDGGVPAYRKLIHPDYKKGRKKPDKQEMELFYNQINLLREIIPNLGIHQIFEWGIEADDLMYHTSRMIDDNIIIISSDADILQTITKNVSVYQPIKKQLVTQDNFKELIGVDQHKFVEYKILVGDKSDNILGINGIGQSTALQLLNTFNTIVDAIDAVKNGYEIQTMIKNKILSIDPEELKRLYNLMSLETDRFGARAIIYKQLTIKSTNMPMNKRTLFNLGVLIGKYKNLDLQNINNVIYNRENIIINRW